MAISDDFCILVVEDRQDDVLVLERAFREAGLSRPVVVVRDGEEALGYLDGCSCPQTSETVSTPALMLLDLKLPRVSGFEILSWVRNHRNLSHLPIIVLSDSEEVSDINRALGLGASDYRVKPTNPEDFVAFVKEIADVLPCGA
jgi:DNA-binding response OmpR family regulator